MKIVELLAMNLRYYRKKYDLSQEKFAEILGTSLSHLNRIEQNKIDVKASSIDKYTNKLNDYDKNLKITSEKLWRSRIKQSPFLFNTLATILSNCS